MVRMLTAEDLSEAQRVLARYEARALKSRRESIAKVALQGLLADASGGGAVPPMSTRECVARAVELADEMIAALDAPPVPRAPPAPLEDDDVPY